MLDYLEKDPLAILLCNDGEYISSVDDIVYLLKACLLVVFGVTSLEIF
jgi:hypothetical protein